MTNFRTRRAMLKALAAASLAAAPTTQAFAASKPALRAKSFNTFFAKASAAERAEFVKELQKDVGAALQKRFMMTPEQVEEFAVVTPEVQARLRRFGNHSLKNDLPLKAEATKWFEDPEPGEFADDFGKVIDVEAGDREISFGVGRRT